MRNEVIEEISDPDTVASILLGYGDRPHICRTALLRFDNLRDDYSSRRFLEFGGIAVTERMIGSMIQRQASELARLAGEFRRLIIFWKVESGRLYATALAGALQVVYGGDVCLAPIRTKWRRTGVAEVVNGVVPPICDSDFVCATDFMCGSGATVVAMAAWLAERQVSAQSYMVLVNATGYERPPEVPAFLSPHFVWRTRDWLIGFNSDCPAAGTEVGRELPFLGFLRPLGCGIRDRLTEVLERRSHE